MNSTTTTAIIRPEAVAAKLAALRNFAAPNFEKAVAASPRLIELLWFVQWLSMQPGGLEKFVDDFLTLFGEGIGTEAMHRIGRMDAEYSAAERHEVIAGIQRFFGVDRRDMLARQARLARELCGDEACGENLPINLRCRENAAVVNKLNHAGFHAQCRNFGKHALPGLLAKLCADPNCAAPAAWWFHDLQGALMEMMDAHAGRLSQTLAMTTVASNVFDTLDFACSQKAMVEISGDSRFGKTEAVKTWCAMHPGRARLVKTPCDNCDRSLLEAIAAAAGIEASPKTSIRELKSNVEYVLKHCSLMFVFDEAAWLLPQRYTAKTVPMRLNYIRSQLLDNGCPVALVKTPQFIDSAAKRFETVTGFNLAQFDGRIMRKVELPKTLPEADLFAVVNVWMPDLREPLKKRIVAAALISESYLFAVEKIAKNSRAVADKKGHAEIEQGDLEEGIALAGIVVPAIRQHTSDPMASNPGQRNVRPVNATPSTIPARDTGATLIPV